MASRSFLAMVPAIFPALRIVMSVANDMQGAPTSNTIVQVQMFAP
jgi:hypothetical protein